MVSRQWPTSPVWPSGYTRALTSTQGVLFDFAGTLFMPRAVNEFVFAASEKLKLDLAPSECGRLASECLTAGFPGGPLPETVPQHLRAAWKARDLSSDAHRAAYTGLLSTVGMPHPELPERIYEQIREPESFVPYADALRVITELRRRGIRVGLISNVGFDLRPVLQAHGFPELAQYCTLSFEVGAAKPDRRIFDAALRTLGSDASCTLMVGDHEPDDRGAEVLGMKTLILPMTAPGSDHGLTKILELV